MMNKYLVIQLLVVNFFATAAPVSRPKPELQSPELIVLRQYARSYKEDLTTVLADEDTVQRVVIQRPEEPGSPTVRDVKSEVSFAFTSADGAWMSIRRVRAVDGEPVKTSVYFEDGLAEHPSVSATQAAKAFNSRFNIGRLQRNFNEPTLALSVLDPEREEAFDFVPKGVTVSRSVKIATLGFREKPSERPLVRDLQMQPALVEGELVFEEATGRLRTTRLRCKLGTVTVELITTYGQDPKLGLFVPVRFNEHYLDISGQSGTLANNSRYEEIDCESRYSDFRRFGTSSRIK